MSIALECEYLAQLKQALNSKPVPFVFSNGCTIYFEEDKGWVVFSSPYGIDSALQYASTQELINKSIKYLIYWSENRDEEGNVLKPLFR